MHWRRAAVDELDARPRVQSGGYLCLLTRSLNLFTTSALITVRILSDMIQAGWRFCTKKTERQLGAWQPTPGLVMSSGIIALG